MERAEPQCSAALRLPLNQLIVCLGFQARAPAWRCHTNRISITFKHLPSRLEMRGGGELKKERRPNRGLMGGESKRAVCASFITLRGVPQGRKL